MSNKGIGNINLREYQYKFIDEYVAKSGKSYPTVIREIIDYFIVAVEKADYYKEIENKTNCLAKNASKILVNKKYKLPS